VMSQAGADPRGRAAPRWLSAGDAVQIDHTITAGTHPNRPADSAAPRAKGKDGDPENTPDARIAQVRICDKRVKRSRIL
jgi:hypothetical protein